MSAIFDSRKRFPRGKVKGAFTLMEVLLAIALIAAASGFVAMSAGIFSEDILGARPPERVFFSALKRAQIESLERGSTIEISYNRDGFFLLNDARDNSTVAKIWLTRELEKAAEKKEPDYGIEIPTADTAVVFIPNYPEVIGSASVSFREGGLKSIRVAPDGTCTPVSVSISSGGEEPKIYKLDPVCASPAEDVK